MADDERKSCLGGDYEKESKGVFVKGVSNRRSSDSVLARCGKLLAFASMGKEGKGQAMMKQASVRIDEQQYNLFKQTAEELGTTISDALRMFIYAFNREKGFPEQVAKLTTPDYGVPEHLRLENMSRVQLLQSLREAEAQIEAGNAYTHDEAFASAYAVIEAAKQQNRQKVTTV